MTKINFHSKRSRTITCNKDKNDLNIRTRVHRRLVNMYLLNVPSVSSPYFNKTFKEIARLIARNPYNVLVIPFYFIS